MTAAVEVRTGARLHFGLFGTRSDQGRLGGIGMMIRRPGHAVRVRQFDRDVVNAPVEIEPMVWKIVGQIRKAAARRYGIQPLHLRIDVDEPVPPHRGFGSGTQLALAIAAAFARLGGASPVDQEVLGRGGRSLVGTVGFCGGGFIADLGEDHVGSHGAKPLHRAVPITWRLLIVDPMAATGFSGATEAEAFEHLRPMPPEAEGRLRSLATDVILPALDARDFPAFASAVADFNRLVGEHFAAVQGGVYAHPLIRELARTLAGTDWPHLAQSSWGPAAAIFCENEASADALQRYLRERIAPGEADILTAAPLNRGAEVTTIELP